MRLRIATRGSALARWQAEMVAGLVRDSFPGSEVELVVVETAGDRRRDVPLSEIGGQGVFVKEVQSAVLEGRADVAVHSAKDLPSTPAEGLVIATVPVRADPRDALVGSTLSGLRAGATVATGSVRRRAQLAWIRPDLTFVDLRGNIPTRLERVPPGGAAVVASAALDRLGLADRAAELLDPAVMLPQVGQGSIAVECAEPGGDVARLLAGIDDPVAHLTLECERGFLARLGGGCDLPVGAYARADGHDVVVEGMIASPDGRVMLRSSRSGPAPDHSAASALGAALAVDLLAAGGSDLIGG